jgi:hypothetical protein
MKKGSRARLAAADTVEYLLDTTDRLNDLRTILSNLLD